MLVDARFDAALARRILPHVVLAQPHLEILRPLPGDAAEGGLGAVGPVLAVVLLEQAGRAERMGWPCGPA